MRRQDRLNSWLGARGLSVESVRPPRAAPCKKVRRLRAERTLLNIATKVNDLANGGT
jgi:hypothetical protein